MERCQPPVFAARGLTKIYRMGEVEVPALRAIALKITPGAVAHIETGGVLISQGRVRLSEPGGFTKV